MASWKKVIVSGSNAELNTLFTSGDITASGDISGSSRWFGGLQSTEDQTYVAVLDTDTGEFKYRLLSSFPGVGG